MKKSGSNHDQGVVVDQFSTDEVAIEQQNGHQSRSDVAVPQGQSSRTPVQTADQRAIATTNGTAATTTLAPLVTPAPNPTALAIVPPRLSSRQAGPPRYRPGLLTLSAGCIGALTMLLLGGSLVGWARQRLLTQWQAQQTQATLAFADRTEQFLDHQQRAATLIVEATPLTAGGLGQAPVDLRSRFNQWQTQLPDHIYEQVALLDREGAVLLQTTQGAAPTLAQRPYVQQAIATAQTTIGLDPATAQFPPAIAIAVPVRQEGTVLQILHLRLAATALAPPLTGENLPDETTPDAALAGYIVAGDGAIVGATTTTAVGQPLTQVAQVSLGALVAAPAPALIPNGADGWVSYTPIDLDPLATELGAIVSQPLTAWHRTQATLGWGLAIATGLAGLTASGTLAWALQRQERPLRLATQTLATWPPHPADSRPSDALRHLATAGSRPWKQLCQALQDWFDQLSSQMTAQQLALTQSQQETEAAIRRAQTTQARLEQVLVEQQQREATYQAQVAQQQQQLAQWQTNLAHLRHTLEHPDAPLPDWSPEWAEIVEVYQAQRDRWQQLVTQVDTILPQVLAPLQQELEALNRAPTPAPLPLSPVEQLSHLQSIWQAQVTQTAAAQTTLATATTQVEASHHLTIASLDTVRLLQRAIATEQQAIQQIQTQLHQVTRMVTALDQQLNYATLATFNASLKASRLGATGRPLAPLLQQARSQQQDATTLTTKLIELLATLTPDVRSLSQQLRTLEPLLRQLDHLPDLQHTLQQIQQSHHDLAAAIAHLATDQSAQLQATEQVLPWFADWFTQLHQTQTRTAQLNTTLPGVLDLLHTLQQAIAAAPVPPVPPLTS